MTSYLPPAQMLAHTKSELDKAFAALNDAYRLFGDAGDWLRSDWPPGTQITKSEIAAKRQMWETISTGKRLINEIKDVAGR